MKKMTLVLVGFALLGSPGITSAIEAEGREIRLASAFRWLEES